MKGQQQARDVTALLRARNPILWIVTREEPRVETFCVEAAAGARYTCKAWDIAQGISDLPSGDSQGNAKEPAEIMDWISALAQRGNERTCWIMRDLPVWLSGPIGATTLRALRNLARLLPSVPPERAQSIIILTPSNDVPAELSNHVIVIDWPLPDREEIAQILDAQLSVLSDEQKATAAPQNGTRDAAIDAAVGLSGDEARACYARSLVQLKKIDAAIVAREKKRVIAREKVLEWYDPIVGGLDAVGGLENLKGFLNERKSSYTSAAREYGLPAPRGVLLVGVPGCGKSLTAKAISTAWQVPLLRVDLGGLKSKFVGESESNLRKAFDVIAAIGRCVVWFDEVEKSLQGATSGSADGGVSSDALGAILTWMQEKRGEAFVVATANEVESLPDAFIRRFDKTFFVDIPGDADRAEVLRVSMRAHNRDASKIDVAAVVRASEGFIGSEIADLVTSAMFVAFNDGAREITTQDMVNAAAAVVPLTKTSGEKIARLRQWASTRASNAAKVQQKQDNALSSARAIDLA